ncbi:3630_t:CDS:2, partial [Acaulospora morrowiae]
MFKRSFVIIIVIAFQLFVQTSATCDVCQDVINTWKNCSEGKLDIDNPKVLACGCTETNYEKFENCYDCQSAQGNWPSEYPTPAQALKICQRSGYLNPSTTTGNDSATGTTNEVSSVTNKSSAAKIHPYTSLIFGVAGG